METCIEAVVIGTMYLGSRATLAWAIFGVILIMCRVQSKHQEHLNMEKLILLFIADILACVQASVIGVYVFRQYG